jgi:hypothetical protein
MTLCIAAACVNNGEPAIVLCADTLASTSTSSSETQYKRVDIGPYTALFSGTISEAREMLSFYTDYLSTNPLPGTPSAAARAEHLRVACRRFKHNKIDHLVNCRAGLSYVEFLKQGDKMEQSWRQRIIKEIEDLSITEELLIASIAPGLTSDKHAFIFRQRLEKIEVHENFACVGEGAEAAEQSLHRRGQVEIISLGKTLYNVYEARRMAELAPSVGKTQTLLSVVVPKEEQGKGPTWQVRAVTVDAKQYLDDCIQRYGPQPVGEIALPEELMFYK